MTIHHVKDIGFNFANSSGKQLILK